jgi:hypothetical protein
MALFGHRCGVSDFFGNSMEIPWRTMDSLVLFHVFWGLMNYLSSEQVVIREYWRKCMVARW